MQVIVIVIVIVQVIVVENSTDEEDEETKALNPLPIVWINSKFENHKKIWI